MISGQNFTKLCSPNAGEIVVQNDSSNSEYLHPFWRYSPLKFEVDRNQAKFCTFWLLKFFWGGPLEILDRDYKTFLSIVQNFVAIDQQSYEKKRKNKRQQNISPLRKLSLPGELINISVKIYYSLSTVSTKTLKSNIIPGKHYTVKIT